MDADRLKSIPLFADLDATATTIVATLASEISMPAGGELVCEGDFSYDMLAIEEGTADVTRGGEHLASLGPGDVVGEIGVVENQTRNATVTAASPMLLVTLDRWGVKRLSRQSPKVLEHLVAPVEQRTGGICRPAPDGRVAPRCGARIAPGASDPPAAASR